MSAPRRTAATVRSHCGTDRGYRLHLKAGEYSCDPCLDAHAAEQDDYRQRRITGQLKVRELMPCGTDSAVRRHQRAGTWPCPDCRAARAEARRSA